MLQIGLISDTHGLLRPEVKKALLGSDFIIHAGDIGHEKIIDDLETIAPVIAVRGNTDAGTWCQRIPFTKTVEIADYKFYVVHDRDKLNIQPKEAEIHAIVTGHSHNPHLEWYEDTLYINPGSAGPRRFHLPVSIGYITINRSGIKGTLYTVIP